MVPAKQEEAGIDLRGMSLLVVAGAWLLGILLGNWIALPALSLLLAAGAALLWLIPLWRDPVARLVMLSVLWLLLGMWRFTISSPVGDPQAISSFIGTGKVEVQGAVTDEPKLQGKTRVLLISVSSISTDGGTSWQNVHGQLEVQTLGGEIDDPYGANYGDNVQLQGKLQPPTPYTTAGVFATMTFPGISVSSKGGNPIIAALYHLRTAMSNIIAQSLPQPEAALLIAILLGLRTPALKPLVNAFTETGTIHLLVPSGFKVTILSGQIIASTRWLYEKRNGAKGSLPAQREGRKSIRWIVTAFVVTCIAAYTILTGAGPAALRAGIMGTLMVIAPRVGRVYNVYTALALAALLISIPDPFVLQDAGFQLSFVGTLSIVLLTSYIQPLFRPIARFPFGHTTGEISASTAAAQIATLPPVALTFKIISIIALVANILTVILLEILILLGFLIVAAGFVFPPLGVLCGWIAWPFLYYVANIIPWLSGLPGAFFPVNNFTGEWALVCGYYGLLALIVRFLFVKWPQLRPTSPHAPHSRQRLAPRTVRILQVSAALVIVLATGTAALAYRPGNQLTITFLSVGPANQPAQGEAVLIQTPDGKTALIDGGPDATSLAYQLDNRLPSWHRSLDAVILTSPRTDHLTGLQDVVTRYQIGEVLDAGMLHPNSGYALWRRTIAERNIHYEQVRQGATIALGSQVTLQVFWPASPLHKSSDEERDDGLIFRLSAPHLKVLFLGAAAMSKYALTNLATIITPDNLQADIVQIVAEAGKNFPAELGSIVQAAHPSYVIISPGGLSAKQRKAGASPIIALPPLLTQLKAEMEQTAQIGTLEISDDGNNWNVHAA